MRDINIRKLKTSILFLLLIVVAIFSHVFIEPKISSILCYIIFFLFFIFEPKYKKFYKSLIPLFLIFCVGMIFSYLHDSRDVMRDLFYFFNPIILIIIGSYIALNVSFDKLLASVVKLGTLLSLIYVVNTIVSFGLFFWNKFEDIRIALGVGNSVSVLALMLLLYSSKYEELHLVYKMKFRVVFMIINLFALILFSSRTYFGIAIIILAFLSYPLFKRNTIRYLFLGLMSIILVLFMLNQFKDTYIVEKMLGSLNEIEITNEMDKDNPYANYRGYETKSALDTYNQSSDLQKIFGMGFGQLIDLKAYFQLAEADWRFIPVLHNGFAYVLVKTGIIGCFLFFFFLIKIISLARGVYKNTELLSLITIAILMSLCFATYIVSGFFNSEFELLMILLGALIQYVILNRRNKITNIYNV